jgi:SAM-dependent methyltransferase
MSKTQKSIFLEQEGDAWFARNHDVIRKRDFSRDDAIVRAIHRCITSDTTETNSITLLEIGCGEGQRLNYLSTNIKIDCFGIEPSRKAVDMARSIGLAVTQGTADDLPYNDHNFDFVVFGFCLYLCDREDLFKIAHEADRVLRKNGWLIIHDFYASTPTRRDYHHYLGLSSYKMDYRKLFDWHPNYTCVFHEIQSHGTNGYSDNFDDWTATSVMRKRSL